MTGLGEAVDRYYTACIPFYREFLGNHWHTGYYAPSGPIGPHDQLRMELTLLKAFDEDREIITAQAENLRLQAEFTPVPCGLDLALVQFRAQWEPSVAEQQADLQAASASNKAHRPHEQGFVDATANGIRHKAKIASFVELTGSRIHGPKIKRGGFKPWSKD